MAASSSYPIAFQPFLIKIPGTSISIPVTDGGVYDNLGLDPLLAPPVQMPNLINSKLGHKIIFVSDAGAPLTEIDEPSTHLRILRTISLIGDQVTRLRRTALQILYTDYDAYGSGWNLNNLNEYNIDVWNRIKESEKIKFPEIDFVNHEVLQLFSTIRTDLNCFSEQEKRILINFGYLCSSLQIYLNCLQDLIELGSLTFCFLSNILFI